MARNEVRRGQAGSGEAGRGRSEARLGEEFGPARRGLVWLGMAGRGPARQGSRRGMAGLGQAGQGAA